MGQPQPERTVIDPLAACTAPLTAFMGKREKRATGFFYRNGNRFFVITNQHVILKQDEEWKADSISLRVHIDPQDLRKNSDFPLPLYSDSQSLWRSLHPQIDLVAIEMQEQNIKQSGKRIVISFFSQKDLPPKDLILGLGDDLLVLGYPLDFYDDVLNLPIVRDAAIASVYPTPFRGNPYFLVGSRVFQGNSGSPVILKPTNYLVRTTGTSLLAGKVTFLVGVLSHTWPIYEGKEPLGLNAVWFSYLVEKLTSD